jgi:hypothetical protein
MWNQHLSWGFSEVDTSVREMVWKQSDYSDWWRSVRRVSNTFKFLRLLTMSARMGTSTSFAKIFFLLGNIATTSCDRAFNGQTTMTHPKEIITTCVFLVESCLNVEAIRCTSRSKTAVNLTNQTNIIRWFVKSAERKCSTATYVGFSGYVKDSFALLAHRDGRAANVKTAVQLTTGRRTSVVNEFPG